MTKKLNFKNETFEVGKSYLLEDIIHMANINQTGLYQHTSMKKGVRKKALHINFKSEDLDLWFIQDTYSTYRCVMFEN